jgi:hypothetical protein
MRRKRPNRRPIEISETLDLRIRHEKAPRDSPRFPHDSLENRLEFLAQARTPVANIIAMLDAVHEFNGTKREPPSFGQGFGICSDCAIFLK